MDGKLVSPNFPLTFFNCYFEGIGTMKVYYEQVMEGEDTRRVFVDGEYYTRLILEVDGSIYAETKHPDINLGELFVDTFIRDAEGFYKRNGIEVEVTIP